MAEKDQVDIVEMKDDDEEVTIVIDSGKEEEPDPDEKKSEGSKEESDQDDPEDADKSDDEREKIRERRRIERKEKKEYQRKYRAEMETIVEQQKRIIYDLEGRLKNVEAKTVKSDMAQLDAAISNAERAAMIAQQRVAEAGNQGNGAAQAEAMREWFEAQKNHEQLSQFKQQASRQAPQAGGIDPLVKRNAEDWSRRNGWYDPSGRDMDSRVALQVDRAMAEEGWDFRDPKSWEELDSRLGKYLPHRYKKDSDMDDDDGDKPSKPRPKSITGGSGRDSNSKLGSNQVNLSADRVRALKELGVWGNEEKMKPYLKSYKNWDKQNNR